MLQQINLYQEIVRKDEQRLALRPLVLAFLGGLVLLLSIFRTIPLAERFPAPSVDDAAK